MSSSRIAEIAEREAAEAEADDATEPDTEPDPEPDEPTPEDEPTPTAAPAPDEAAEKAFAAIERAAGNYGRAVGKALEGVELAVEPCPLCVTPGLVQPFEPGTPDGAETQSRVFAYFGAGQPDYKRATNTDACEACDGWGQVVTGSRNDTNRLKLCDVCSGTGWVTTSAVVAPVQPSGQQPNGSHAQDISVTAGQVPDVWGRPAGHRFYGQVPGTET